MKVRFREEAFRVPYLPYFRVMDDWLEILACLHMRRRENPESPP